MITSSSLSSATSRTARTAGTGVRAVALAVVVNVVVSTLVAWLIGRLAIAVGAPADTMQYRLQVLAVAILVASLVGALGWTIVRRWAAKPQSLIRVLAPAVVIVSLVPDVLLGVGGAATWVVVGGLMVMHVVVAAITVAVFSRLMPLSRARA